MQPLHPLRNGRLCMGKTPEGLRVEVTVPCGVEAALVLHGRQEELTAGTHRFIV